MLRSAIFGLSIWISWALALYPAASAEEHDARYAALFIYSTLSLGIATLQACQNADASNEDVYAAVIGKHVAENFPFYGRIDEILKAEAKRHGFAETHYTTSYPKAMAEAKAWVRDNLQNDQAEFLKTCRALPEAQRRHVGYYAPLKDQYPAEMRLIDEWR
jgi:hypothetical protein